MSKRVASVKKKSRRPHKSGRGANLPSPPRRNFPKVSVPPRTFVKKSKRERSYSPPFIQSKRGDFAEDSPRGSRRFRDESPGYVPDKGRLVGDSHDSVGGLYDRRRLVPSNFLSFSKEMKHVYFSAAGQDVSPYSFVGSSITSVIIFPSLCLVPATPGSEGRESNKISVQRIALKIRYRADYTFAKVLPPPPVGTFDFETRHQVRLCIILDRQCRGVAPSSLSFDDLFRRPVLLGGSRFDVAYREAPSVSRYSILYDKIHTIDFSPPVTYADGVSPGATASVGWYPSSRTDIFEVFYEEPFDVRFLGPGSNVADIDSNNVFVVAFPADGLHPSIRVATAYVDVAFACLSFVDY